MLKENLLFKNHVNPQKPITSAFQELSKFLFMLSIKLLKLHINFKAIILFHGLYIYWVCIYSEIWNGIFNNLYYLKRKRWKYERDIHRSFEDVGLSSARCLRTASRKLVLVAQSVPYGYAIVNKEGIQNCWAVHYNNLIWCLGRNILFGASIMLNDGAD